MKKSPSRDCSLLPFFPHERQELANYMAEEVEADIWERVAAEMVSAQAHSSVCGGLVRAFITDLGRVVDGRKVGWGYVIPGPARVQTAFPSSESGLRLGENT